jgi:2-(1,2-epoxy-1,2-dihydrophenyl)acetyl-CoA isomerase
MAIMNSERLELSISNGVARLVLSRPEAANAIDLVFAREIEAAAKEIQVQHARVVVMSALGRQFCVGGDLKSFSKQEDLASHLEKVTAHLHEGIATLTELDAPLILEVNGAVAGAGLGLVCAADLVIAGESSTYLMAYTRLGLSPDGSSSWFLARHVGLHRALELSLTNRVLSAREALEWGIVTRVVEDEDVTREAESLVAQLASGPTGAYGATKQLLRSASGNSLRGHLAAEGASISSLARTADGVEGVAAFAERREATYTGV